MSHYLAARYERRFDNYWQKNSLRRDKNRTHKTIGCIFYASMEVFRLIGAVKQPFPICLELWIPTLAYHQGFRIRSLRDQEKYVSWHGNKTDDIKSAQEDGSWFVHPIKNIKTVKN